MKIYFKTIIICGIILLLCFLSACSETVQPGIGSVTKEFKLLDVSGNERNVFRSGEDFEMRLTLINKTGKDLNYFFSGSPQPIFQIEQVDSIVATSIDGLVFVQPFESFTLKTNDTLIYNWIAPNTPAKLLDKILTPGKFKAAVIYNSLFTNFEIEQTEPIDFEIIE